MTWFKVDDSFHSHPKALAAGPAAVGLWLFAGTWSCANLTDGFVPDYVLPRLAEGAQELARTLVTVGLWRRAKGGHRFHDWDVYQRSREEVLEERQKWAEKKANQREAKRAKGNRSSSRGAMSPGDTPEDSPGESSSSRSRSRSRTSSKEEVDQDASHPSSSAIEDRGDVGRVCAHLAARIVENGSKRPTITKTWLTAARLMIDRDGRTEEQVHACIDWCQGDEFWRANILSMPKLREKYDQLSLQAQAQRSNGTQRGPDSEATGTQRARQAIEAGRELQAMVDRGEITL